LGLLAGYNAAQAQLPQARLYSVFPAGAKAGTSFEITLAGGADLDEVDRLLFSHPGITATQKMQGAEGAQQPVPNVFVVNVAADVPPGDHEIRAAGLFGLTNPRTLVVGAREEVLEAEPNDTPEQAGELVRERIVNGRSDKATDVDFYKFPGKKGERILAVCEALRIDSKFAGRLELYAPDGRRIDRAASGVRRDPLLDATLPADGEYRLKVHDATYQGGAEFVYRLLLTAGPRIDYVMPPAGLPGSKGKYTVYGRNLPGGQPAEIATFGHPLEKLEVEIALPENAVLQEATRNLWPVQAAIDGTSYALAGPAGPSNSLLIPFAAAPVVLEQEPNNEPAQAQTIAVPGEIAGQFQSPGDVDFVQFEAKTGEVYYLEVFGERQGTTADPYLTLDQVTKNDKGEETVKRITALDDVDANAAPNVFDTRTDDPVYRFQVPANGLYRVSLRDRYFETRGDPTLVYRLAIRTEQPDFRLVVLPHLPPQANDQGASTWEIGLRKGDNRPLNVVALRRDGYNGVIELTLEGLPEGVSCPPVVMQPGESAAEMILTAAENAPEWIGHVRVIGKAKIGEQDVVREARAGTLVWSGAQNVPAVSRVARTLGLAVLKEQAPFQVTSDATRIEVNQGRQVLLSLKAARRLGFDADLALTMVGLSNKSNIDVQAKPIPKGKSDDLVRLFVKENATLGTYSLYLKAQAQVQYRRNPFADDRAKAEQAAAAEAANAAAEAAKKGAEALDAAAKKLAADNEALKGAVAAVPVAEKASTDAQAAVKAATDAHAAAVAAAQSTQTMAEAAARVAAVARQRADEAAANAKSATEADQAGAQATAEAAAGLAALAQKLADEQRAAAKSAEEARAAAEKQLADANAAAQKAAEAVAAAKKGVVDAEAVVKASTEAKAAAEAVAKETDAKSKAAAAVKEAADKKAAETAKASAPQKVNDFAPSTPIVLVVKRAPANLSAAVPNKGELKRGTKIEVKVGVKRVNGFAGPVTLSLPLPPGVAGVTAAPVTIPADKEEGVMTIEAAADATEGDLAHMVIRGAMEFEGQAEVDAPIALKVVP